MRWMWYALTRCALKRPLMQAGVSCLQLHVILHTVVELHHTRVWQYLIISKNMPCDWHSP